jgi:hypothetical protein
MHPLFGTKPQDFFSLAVVMAHDVEFCKVCYVRLRSEIFLA